MNICSQQGPLGTGCQLGILQKVGQGSDPVCRLHSLHDVSGTARSIAVLTTPHSITRSTGRQTAARAAELTQDVKHGIEQGSRQLSSLHHLWSMARSLVGLPCSLAGHDPQHGHQGLEAFCGSRLAHSCRILHSAAAFEPPSASSWCAACHGLSMRSNDSE